MKSFSFKAFALAFVVVTGSANALPGVNYVKTKLFGSSTTYVDVNGKLVKLEKAMAKFPQVDFSNAEKTVRYHNNGAVNSAKEAFKKATNSADKTLFGEFEPSFAVFDNDDANGEIKGGILPNCFYFNSGYKRAAFAVVATAAITAAVVKAYKHFTTPAADATEEGDNVEANETTPEVA